MRLGTHPEGTLTVGEAHGKGPKDLLSYWPVLPCGTDHRLFSRRTSG